MNDLRSLRASFPLAWAKWEVRLVQRGRRPLLSMGVPMKRGGWYWEVLWLVQEWLDRRWEVFE